MQVVLLGLGFTTRRLARRLLFRGTPVFGVSRNCERFENLSSLGVQLSDFSLTSVPRRAIVVHSIPTLPEVEAHAVHEFIQKLEPVRIIYISTSGVYGSHTEVNAQTEVDPTAPKAQARIEEERWVSGAAPVTLTLRPAAIYGPGRGVHVRILNGEPVRGAGTGVVSRIHVDDLAGLLEAGVYSNLNGHWPVADDYPCSSDEIGAWCSRLLRLPANRTAGLEGSGRAVDGRAIRESLGYRLIYPNYQAGILASLAEEKDYRAAKADGVIKLT